MVQHADCFGNGWANVRHAVGGLNVVIVDVVGHSLDEDLAPGHKALTCTLGFFRLIVASPLAFNVFLLRDLAASPGPGTEDNMSMPCLGI